MTKMMSILTVITVNTLRQTKFQKGDAGNPIVNTVLPHDIFNDWVLLLQGKDRNGLIFACFASLTLKKGWLQLKILIVFTTKA